MWGESVRRMVGRLVHQYVDLWWEDADSVRDPGITFSKREQGEREGHLARFLDAVTGELQSVPQTRSERLVVQERILSAFEILARSALGFEDRHLEILLNRGFTEAGTSFVQTAGLFDPSIGGASVFKAIRNVWAMNGLQMLLGLPVRLTPAVFAYSMLYPYTDNFLDDPSIPGETKARFNERFAQRLAGEPVAPLNSQEQPIWDLLGLIEGQYSRSEFPHVFESLLAIHRAQEKSLRLLHRDASPNEVDVLGIAIEKGGTSVLADGYLVAGSLTPAQAEFLFGYGAFLQLADDLQDVRGDLDSGLLTVFSQAANHWPLDALTDKAFDFAHRVLPRVESFAPGGPAPLKELMARSARTVLINAVGRSGRFFTESYRRSAEARSPFRFAFLKKCRRRLARQRVSLTRLVGAFALAADAEAPFALPGKATSPQAEEAAGSDPRLHA